MKKRLFLLYFVLILAISGFSANINHSDTVKVKNKVILGLLPSKANHIYGLAFGLIGSECMCAVTYKRYSHGLNIQIPGQGVFWTGMFVKSFKKYKPKKYNIKDYEKDEDTWVKSCHNGLLLSLTGTFTSKINGVSLSPWMSRGYIHNGIAINLLFNDYMFFNGIAIGLKNRTYEIKGIQIGLINHAKKMKGIQIGLWNKNEHRSLPIINWGF